jgi:cell fate regulator YaaT (PSP1 superfamily)
MNEETTAPVAVKEPSMFDSPEWTGISEEKPQRESRDALVGIRFQAVGKIYHYNATGYANLKVGSWVIVDSARGRQMGQVATLKPPRTHGGPYKRIERIASGRDMAMRHYYENKELEAMIACRAESSGLKLPIKIVRAEYSFDGATLTFLFSSDQEERIETGELRDRMSHLYQARIEMRQISPREVAKILGGMGACGIEERCCSKFLTDFSPVSIKHAKEQNLSLNPNDITGMCGRLRCCLVFEYEQYVEAKSHLPKLKSMIGTPSGEGKVVELLHLRDSVKVRLGEGFDAREMIFHREQLTPLEELRRLQEKAMAGTCDRHEGGGCDCGRKGPKQTAPADAPSDVSNPDASAPVFKPRDPERDAQIKARQEKVKAKLAEKQKRRDEIRKQLKAKALAQRAAGQEGSSVSAERSEGGPADAGARAETPRMERSADAPRAERAPSERRDRGERGGRSERGGVGRDRRNRSGGERSINANAANPEQRPRSELAASGDGAAAPQPPRERREGGGPARERREGGGDRRRPLRRRGNDRPNRPEGGSAGGSDAPASAAPAGE